MPLSPSQIRELADAFHYQWNLQRLVIFAALFDYNLQNEAPTGTLRYRALKFITDMNTSGPPRDRELLKELSVEGNANLRSIAEDLLKQLDTAKEGDHAVSTEEISGKWKQDFREALASAFTYPDMQMLISDYFSPLTFARVAPVGPTVTYENQLYGLIEGARMEGWLSDLVAAAHERRPKNQRIREIAEGEGLTVSGPRLDSPTDMPLEKVIDQNRQFFDPIELFDRLSILQGQVCWIDIPDGGGTGFLVGPDLLLTTDHIIKGLREGRVSPDDVKCYFDYKETIEGAFLSKKKITEVKLETDNWLIDWLPSSQYDLDPSLGDAGELELDYGLIRLAERVADLPVGGATSDLEAMSQPRGWIDTSADPPALAPGNQVFVLQHPEGRPLKLSLGRVTEFNRNGTRLRHDANTERGSAGSPCFNADLQLVALHHAGYARWNQAIPFGKIRAAWQDRNISVP